MLGEIGGQDPNKYQPGFALMISEIPPDLKLWGVAYRERMKLKLMP